MSFNINEEIKISIKMAPYNQSMGILSTCCRSSDMRVMKAQNTGNNSRSHEYNLWYSAIPDDPREDFDTEYSHVGAVLVFRQPASERYRAQHCKWVQIVQGRSTYLACQHSPRRLDLMKMMMTPLKNTFTLSGCQLKGLFVNLCFPHWLVLPTLYHGISTANTVI